MGEHKLGIVKGETEPRQYDLGRKSYRMSAIRGIIRCMGCKKFGGTLTVLATHNGKTLYAHKECEVAARAELMKPDVEAKSHVGATLSIG